MRDSQPKRCSYDELGGICNVPIADNAEFCENHTKKSRDNKQCTCVVLAVAVILFLGFITLPFMCSTP